MRPTRRRMALAVVALLCGAGALVVTRTRDAHEPSIAAVEANREQHSTADAAPSNSSAARLQPAALATAGGKLVDTSVIGVARQQTADAQPNSSQTFAATRGSADSAAHTSTKSVTTSLPGSSAASPNEKPTDWGITGSNTEGYTLQTDRLRPLSGGACAALLAIPDADTSRFGALFQAASARGFVGKRLELSGYIASHDAPAGASLWLRADAADGTTVGFDNTLLRGIRGTQDWTYQNIVMDIPPEATNLIYGAVLNGRGTLYVDDLQFRIVDENTSVTAKPVPVRARPSVGAGSQITLVPRNLDFEQTQQTEPAR